MIYYINDYTIVLNIFKEEIYMNIDNETYKQKVVNEIKEIIDNDKVKWKALNGDDNDYMTIINYSYKPNPKRGETKTLSFMYRVCCFGNIPRIIIYDNDKANKNGPTDTTELPNIVVSDNGVSNSQIFDLMVSIKNKIEENNKLKDEKLLDKLTWYLNNKKGS